MEFKYLFEHCIVMYVQVKIFGKKLDGLLGIEIKSKFWQNVADRNSYGIAKNIFWNLIPIWWRLDVQC